jgi:hypothetical protein
MGWDAGGCRGKEVKSKRRLVWKANECNKKKEDGAGAEADSHWMSMGPGPVDARADKTSLKTSSGFRKASVKTDGARYKPVPVCFPWVISPVLA